MKSIHDSNRDLSNTGARALPMHYQALGSYHVHLIEVRLSNKKNEKEKKKNPNRNSLAQSSQLAVLFFLKKM